MYLQSKDQAPYRITKRPLVRRIRKVSLASLMALAPSLVGSPLAILDCSDWDSLLSPPSLPSPSPEPHQETPTIFTIPEIVHRILSYVDTDTVVPQEGMAVSKRPLLIGHACLIRQNEAKAHQWLRHQPTTTVPASLSRNLSQFILVNKLWCNVAKAIIGERVLFANERNWHQLTSQPHCHRHLNRPRLIVLHKLIHSRQHLIDLLIGADWSRLQWLEFYMCPKLLPPVEMLGPQVTKIVITGSKVVDDLFLEVVARKCPNLRELDLRACDLVSDAGIYQIARNCSHLHVLNLGRKHKGHLITDSSIGVVARHCRSLHTLGVAGCDITDKLVWELAAHRSDRLQRLSLNNCRLITDNSVPLILSRPHPSLFQHLAVLELGNTSLSNWRPVIEFRRRQEYKGIAMVVEMCERLRNHYHDQEMEMDKVISQRMFSDILHWANDPNDGDMPFHSLLKH